MFINFLDKQVMAAPFLASLLSGLITSLLFLFIVLFVFRPRIHISPHMAKAIDVFDPAQRCAWAVKIVNRSYFSAFDMRVEFSQKFSFPGPNGLQNYRVIPLPLVKDQYPYVAPFRPQMLKKGYSDYAIRFRTYQDIDHILSDQRNTIEVRIICRHALTGLGSVFIYEYTQHGIKVGVFKSGSSFDVV